MKNRKTDPLLPRGAIIVSHSGCVATLSPSAENHCCSHAVQILNWDLAFVLIGICTQINRALFKVLSECLSNHCKDYLYDSLQK